MLDILILLVHPAVAQSPIHSCLTEAAAKLKHVSIHNLYATYPDFVIDRTCEQELLQAHDVILMQHPLYWYSSPALLKEWQDVVLDHGFAYGEGGSALHGKALQQVVTTGSTSQAFTGEGDSRTMEEVLIPFERTARKCGMRYLPPYVIHNAGRLGEKETEREVWRYRKHLESYHGFRHD